jgi:hypothetical protein
MSSPEISDGFGMRSGLQPDTVIDYRVVAVGRDGSKGEPANGAKGVTRDE